MADFEGALPELAKYLISHEVHEIGRGEGYWTLRWLGEGYNARGSDFSNHAVSLACANAAERGLEARFKVASIYDLIPEKDAAELVVCCEVLEHLERPHDALDLLTRLARCYVIVSVPREPLWRFLNLARGKYLSEFGNTPGHIQHWSRRGFIDLIGQHFDVVETRAPIPWTMVLARPKA